MVGQAYSLAELTKEKEEPEQLFTTQMKLNVMETLDRLVDGIINCMSPILQVFGSVADNETCMYKAIMEQPDFRDFIKAMEVDIKDHTDRNHWLVRKRRDCEKSKTILKIWSFKRKRFLDGKLNKHKTRLCVHRHMKQWGI